MSHKCVFEYVMGEKLIRQLWLSIAIGKTTLKHYLSFTVNVPPVADRHSFAEHEDLLKNVPMSLSVVVCFFPRVEHSMSPSQLYNTGQTF